MEHDNQPFEFPDLPDEAVVAIDQFLEAFYIQFENHYFAQMYRHYYPDQPPLRSGRRYDDQLSLPLDDPPF